MKATIMFIDGKPIEYPFDRYELFDSGILILRQGKIEKIIPPTSYLMAEINYEEKDPSTDLDRLRCIKCGSPDDLETVAAKIYKCLKCGTMF